MARRLVLMLALAAAVSGLASAGALGGGGLGNQKEAVDAKLAAVQAKLAAQRRQEGALHTQIDGLTSQIHTLELQVGNVSNRLSVLQQDLGLHERRLAKLDSLFRVQTTRLGGLRSEYALSVRRLDVRLVAIYEQNDPTTIDVLLAAKSFQDAIDQLDYLGAIGAEDKKVADAVELAKQRMSAARAQTKTARQGVQDEARVINARVQQQAILVGELRSSQGQLIGARSGKASALAATRAQEASTIQESQALAAASAQLAAKLRAVQTPSAAAAGDAQQGSVSFIWPVSGPITSPFGMRWGSLHPGIDIGVPTGTPIHAAAAGTVVWCGWMSGYGNLVMIDHGSGIATLYGHQSRVAVSCNEQVAQGQLIGYSGCTGFCTGPHVHFEVRVNGTPVDPIGYLP